MENNRKRERLISLIDDQLLEESSHLPLVHVSDVYSFDDILIERMLSPQHCEVFNEPLLYFFYGRPAYRTKYSGKNDLAFDLPVALVFDNDGLLNKIKRVFPFDTGAFKYGLYKDFFHRRSKLEDYELEPDLSSAAKIVSYFYLDKENYYFGGSRKNVNIPVGNFEAAGIFEMARQRTYNDNLKEFKPDQRATAIEIQVNQDVAFNDSLIGLILPQIYLDIPEICEAVKQLNPKYLEVYTVISNCDPTHLTGTLFEKVHSICKREGLF